jgi:hypothetical protein
MILVKVINVLFNTKTAFDKTINANTTNTAQTTTQPATLMAFGNNMVRHPAINASYQKHFIIVQFHSIIPPKIRQYHKTKPYKDRQVNKDYR